MFFLWALLGTFFKFYINALSRTSLVWNVGNQNVYYAHSFWLVIVKFIIELCFTHIQVPTSINISKSDFSLCALPCDVLKCPLDPTMDLCLPGPPAFWVALPQISCVLHVNFIINQYLMIYYYEDNMKKLVKAHKIT